MEDVSNKTIVSLLIIALIVTVIGTVVSVSKLGTLGKYAALGGAATSGNATTTVTVTSNVGIAVSDATVDFGTGYVNPGQVAATVWSNGTSSQWTNNSGLGGDQYIEIYNTGNIVANITVAANDSNAETWLCAAGACASTAVAALGVKTTDNQSTSCADFNMTVILSNETYQAIQTATDKSTVNLCESLGFAAASHSIKAYFNLTIPFDAGVAAHTETLTFTGAAPS